MFDDFFASEEANAQRNETFSVQALTQYISDLISTDKQLRQVNVQGEISNLTIARSGHWYFTLKDAKSSLSCAMFKTASSRQSFRPNEGDEVTVSGSIRIYAERGVYQLYAENMTPVGGIGDLYQKFEALKQQLASEGLFDGERKRPIPLMPRIIGIVTSVNAAALRDMRHVIERRYPQAEIILSSTLVQGATAPAEIVQALQRLYDYQPAPDVIIIARGGGSIEDLWSFNDERVARAIAVSPYPIISGVGHETDFTIADFVADERAPTPSAAAERATPDRAEIYADLIAIRAHITRIMTERLAQQRQEILYVGKSLNYNSPQQHIDSARQQADEWLNRITGAQSRYVDRLQERLNTRLQALNASSPQSILARGYAIVRRNADGSIIRSAKDAPDGTAITIQTQQDQLNALITGDNETS